MVASLPLAAAWDGVIYLRAAEQLARGEGYTLRILSEAAPALPTAFYPVGHPALLAALIALGLHGAALRVAIAALGSLAIVGAALLGRRLAGRRAGIAAAWLTALHPGSVLLGGSMLAEPTFAALLCLVLAFAAYRRRASRAAFALGWLSLMRPVAAPTAVLLGAFEGAFEGRRSVRGALVGALGATVLVVLALSGWALRNERSLGSPVPIATNGGFNLLLGTVGGGAYQALPEGVDCAPDVLAGAHGTHFELARDACRQELALARIRDAPFAALARTLAKLMNTFGHESTPSRHLAASLGHDENGAIVVLGVVCGTAYLFALYAWAVRGWRRHLSLRTARILLSPILATALVHGLVLGGDRYHLAIVPCLAALAAARWVRGRGECALRFARVIPPVP